MEKLIFFMKENTIKQSEGKGVTDCYRNLEVNPDADIVKFKELVNEVNNVILDGEEHSYIELGGLLGSQHLALSLMVFGAKLGVWQLLTPEIMKMPEELWSKMEGQGYITIAPISQK